MWRKGYRVFLLAAFLCVVSPFAGRAEGCAPRLSEIMAANNGAAVDRFGNTPGWIELHNPTDTPISLEGFCLSDRSKDPWKFRFPEGAELDAGAYLLVYASGREILAGGEWHAPFKLNAGGETVYLSKDGEILEQATFQAMEPGVSYALGEDEAFHLTRRPTPGTANQIVGTATVPQPAATEGVRLNEVLASNSITKNGNRYAFIELYNPTGKPIALTGYSLSLSEKKTYVFPAKSAISARGYVLVYCTGNVSREPKGTTHYAPFSIPLRDAAVTLLSPDGEVADKLTLPQQYGNVSYGRPPDGGAFGYLEAPTPGRPNPKTAYAARHASPVPKTPAGFYSEPVSVEVISPDGAPLRYTLDGSVPTADSAPLTGPLVFRQTGVLRVRALSGEALASETVTATYFIGLDVPSPVVSLSTDSAYLYHRDTGLMAPGNNKSRWENPVHIEYYDEDGVRSLNQMCGFRLAGEISRLKAQKGLNFYARKGYGQGRFEFAPFENRAFTSYKSFALRAAGSEGMGNGARFRDALLTSLGEDTHVLVQAAKPVLVFMNGQCWGHYNLREKVNRAFVAQHEGVTDPDIIDRIDLLKRTGLVLRGSNADYKALISFVKQNDLNKPENLAHVLARMDVDSYFDHCILEIVTGNEDINNYKFYRVPGGKWKWILYDLDTAMGRLTSAPLSFFMKNKRAKPEHGFDHAPFAALMEVPEMREKFLLRMGELMAEKFTYAGLSARMEGWESALSPLIPYQIDKWGQLTRKSWEAALAKMDSFLYNRPPVVVKHVRTAFKLTDEEVRLYFGAYLDTL